MDVKDIKCPFQWKDKHETMFLTIGFLVHWILGIVGSQIETEKNLSLLEWLLSLGNVVCNWKFKEVDICQQKLA